MAKKHTLQKIERLKSQATIGSLFSEGKSTFTFPLKIQYQFISLHPSPIQFGVSVPKKKFKRAVDRNKIKRIIRESYRTSNGSLKQKLIDHSQHLAMMVIFVGPEIPEFTLIDKVMKKLLVDLVKQIS